MIKKLIIPIILVLILIGCGITNSDETVSATDEQMFVMIQKPTYADDPYYVVYHKDTKVVYVVSNGLHNKGNFTMLVDKDGKPLLYGGE